MIPDVRFEAEFLRAALLLGAVREQDVRDWADALLIAGAEPIALLSDVALAPPELTALREALRPLAAPSIVGTLGDAVVTFLGTEPSAISHPLNDRIRLLGQLRREAIVAPDRATSIKAFEDRSMLTSAGIGVDTTLGDDLERWFAAESGPRFYRFTVPDADEAAALLGALSRKVVRDRRMAFSPLGACQAWRCESVSRTSPTLLLSAALWQIAVAEFSPLPLGSRIPYAGIPANSVPILDEATAEPMGAREAGGGLTATDTRR